MMVQGFMYVTGFNYEFSAVFVGGALVVLAIMAPVAIGELWYGFRLRETTPHLSQRTSGGISGAAPDLPVPSRSTDECGGKFCELRGCAILGSCQNSA